MHHHKAYDSAEEQVAAKHARRRNRNDDRQIREGRIGHHVKELIPVSVAKIKARDLAERFDQTHQEAGCHDSRKNRDKHVADRLQKAFPQRLFCGRSCFYVILCRSRHARDGKELVIDLIDRSCSDDELKLSVGFEHALHAVNVVEIVLVYLAVILDDQSQAGCTVCRLCHIFPTADMIDDLLCTFAIIQSHFVSPFPLFCCSDQSLSVKAFSRSKLMRCNT